MPFTFSHPAIILPLTYLPKRWFSLTGLIVGSLIPDFEYFLRMKIRSDFSHTLQGILWFDLPLAILIAFIFHNLVRNNLFKSLPFFLRSRLIRFNDFNWNSYFKKNWLVVILSILVGTASHIFWDSFTHDSNYFVNIFPELTNSIELLHYQIPILKILQHSSTCIGAMIICISIYKLPSSPINKQSININYWLTFIISFGILFFFLIDFKTIALGTLIVSTISTTLLSLISTSILIKIRSKKT